MKAEERTKRRQKKTVRKMGRGEDHHPRPRPGPYSNAERRENHRDLSKTREEGKKARQRGVFRKYPRGQRGGGAVRKHYTYGNPRSRQDTAWGPVRREGWEPKCKKRGTRRRTCQTLGRLNETETFNAGVTRRAENRLRRECREIIQTGLQAKEAGRRERRGVGGGQDQ